MHVMIDLETLGTGATSVILSIGLVAFDDGNLYDELEIVLDEVAIDQQIHNGRDVSASTLKWWFKQSEKARSGVLSETGVSNSDAVFLLLEFLERFDTIEGVWGNGASFDNAMLNDWYVQGGTDGKRLWSYSKDRCFRTLKALFSPELPLDNNHNALDDARNQARIASGILRELRTQAAVG